MVTVSLIVCIYYNVIMSYTVFYMVSSFTAEVPWSKCDPSWADMATCYVRGKPVVLVSYTCYLFNVEHTFTVMILTSLNLKHRYN